MATAARPSLAATLGDWEQRPLEEKIALRAALRRVRWRFLARDDQLPPKDWQKLYYPGGRGSGKTWTAANLFAEEIHSDPERTQGAWGVVAPTFADARDKCIESDESGLLKALGTSVAEVKARRSPVVETWNRSIGELILRDGTRIVIDGADDGAPGIQGENLRGAWGDEVGLWKQWKMTYDESIGFALRKGRSRLILTGTPKRAQPARVLIRRLLNDPKVITRRLRTADNWDNLSQTFRDTVAQYVGTSLGDQELEGMLLENAEGALWQLDWIEERRVDELPYPPNEWQGPPVVGVDPSDGNEDGAGQAYTVVALGLDHDLYVLEQETLRGSRTAFARHVILRTAEIKGRIVIEKNHGGGWLEDVFRRAMTDLGVQVPLKTVSASQGKLTRADPIAALYEPRRIKGTVIPGRVRHVGYFEALEDQMVNFTGAAGETSPDELDSLVWALSEFTSRSFGPSLPDHLDRAVPYADERSRGVDESGLLDGAVAWR